MRSFLLLFFLFAMGTLSLAQPVNDNCVGLIDLGVVPTCDPTVYTNVGATASNIGFGNNPSCFNGGTTQRDVWFSFTTTTDLTDITITLVGVLGGPNADAILNPQIALYRGDCEVDGLAELSCISAPAGATQIQLDILGLTPDIPYYIRINDYSASASPNSGDFTLCVEEYVPAINIGTSPGTTACFGTLFDSGGPDEDYGDNENATFVICPNDFHACIELALDNFNLEQGSDFLNVYAGSDVNAPLITSITGTDNGQGFPIQATSQCVTVEFISDGGVVGEGFSMTWECSPLACTGNSIDNPTVIGGIPFTQNGFNTCSGAAIFGDIPCNNAPFINGPQYVFAYNSPGGSCASIVLSGAQGGTGILVLNGPPDDPNTVCIAQSNSGNIGSANFDTPGTYYIVVSNPQGCTNFNISLQEADCLLLPSLANALCNPLNGCVEEGVPSLFNFENGFQDIDVTTAINGGCWLGTGFEPDFYWFTIEAQAAGPLGFIFESPDPSDIDFNVWGPFTPQQVCESPGQVINFISNNQPIRSSWAAGADPTGLADIHPILGTPVDDAYDCGGTPGAGGDDFVSTINAQPGEVYVVLVNDFGEGIATAGMLIDWAPSSNSVLFPPTPEVVAGDTAVCLGESVQIEVFSSVNSIQWVGPTAASLSCTNCFTPVATPAATTTYQALIDAVCYTDTVNVTVQVFDVDAGPDLVVCRGEEIQLQAGEFFNNATYNWAVPAGLQFSCTDCPNPIVTAITAGVYPLTISLDAAGCDLQDAMILTVLPADAAQYTINDDQQICEGEVVQLGGPQVAGVTYVWTSIPIGFASTVSNPTASPSQTTTYYLAASNATCPVPSLDSIRIEVFANPIISISSDTAVCQSSSIVLGSTTPEPGVSYLWTGPSVIEDPTNPNSLASPEAPGTYTLTATRGGCSATESFDVTITPIAIAIQQAEPIRICQGTAVNLNVDVVPAGAQAVWTPNNGSLNTNIGNSVIATPQTFTQYIARVDVPGCFKTDTIRIVVDSLPSNLAITPSDTTICQGATVVLTSPIFEPADFPGISFQWTPNAYAETSDTLFNLVVTPDTTIDYARIVRNGVCFDTTFTHILVNKIPIATITPTEAVVCAGEPVQLGVTFNVEVDEITWTPSEGLSCSDCPGPVAVLGQTTTLTVSGDNNGCTGGASTTIEVLGLPVVNLNTQRIICQGDNIQLALGSDPTVTYSWTSTDPDFNATSDPEPIVSPDETATYTVIAQNASCNTTAEITIEVVPDVTLEATIAPTVVCAGSPITLTAEASQSSTGETFEWTSANGESFSGATAIIVPGQTDTYYLVYTSGNGCQTLRDTLSVTVLDDIEVNISITDPDAVDRLVPLGQEVNLKAIIESQSTVPPTITWGGGPIVSAAGDSVVVQPVADGTLYFVEVSTPEGCLARDTVIFDVEDPLFEVPKAFTPNGDERNDVFKFLSSGLIKEVVEFKVFNRWGQVVFEAKDNSGWDGTQKGEPAPSDVYIYHIVIRTFDDVEHDKHGDVTLLR